MQSETNVTLSLGPLVDSYPVAALVHDAEGRVVAANDRLRLLARTDQVVGRLLAEVFDTPPTPGDAGSALQLRVAVDDALLEARATSMAVELPGGAGALLVFPDVHRRPHAMQARARRVETVDHIFDVSSFAYYQLDAVMGAEGDVVDFRFVDCNRAAEAELGLTREALLGGTIRELFPINDSGGFFGQYRSAFLEQQSFEQEYEIPAGSTGAGWYAHEVIPLPDGVAIFNRDIGALKSAELALRQVLDTIPDPVVVMSADGIIRRTNSATSSVFGYARSELEGHPVTRLMPPDYAALHHGYVDTHVSTGRRSIIGRSREVVGLNADGVELPLRLVVGVMQSVEGPVFVGSMHDLRQVRALEEDLDQARRMEALGRLASGLAHDFNNLLVVITQNAQLLGLDLPDGEPHALADEIEQAGQQAAVLTRQLLQFSRRDATTAQVVDVGGELERFGRMAQRLLGGQHALEIELPTDPCPVVIDPTQLDQVLLNLVVNARDAMPDGGTLRVRAMLDMHDGSSPAVRILVEDEGEGIPEDVQAKVFEPFFTTKPRGRGTGLGLSTVFGIVSRAGGHVDLHSQIGVGTRVTVNLPLALSLTTLPPPPSRPPTLAPDAAASRVGDIVLVDDEPLVRVSIARWLTRWGHSVKAFSSAEEAWPALIDDDCACLITDVMMPGTTGLMLVEHVRRRRPGLPVILISGRPDVLPGKSRVDVRTRVLEKPFAPDMLLEALGALMAA